MDAAENKRLCETGRDTDMGRALRRYWIPACLSSDLPKAGAPIRVRLLGDNLVAWRGENGKIGIMDEHCMHRRASLVYARAEDSALRCLFHGWKFATDGSIVDLPNVTDTKVKDRLKARAYPVEESHGLVWTYLGPLDNVPPRPKYSWESLPQEHTFMWPIDLDCNWAQSFEGLIDSAHLNFLHADRAVSNFEGRTGLTEVKNFHATAGNSIPRFEVELTDFGFQYAALRRDAGEKPGTMLVRMTAYAAPYLAFVPPSSQAFMMIPVDDTHCKMLHIWWSTTERLDEGPGREFRLKRWGVGPDMLAATGTNPVMPGPAPEPPRNRIPQDRAAMQAGRSLNGLPGLSLEDALMGISMGPISDRTGEHLIATDAAVVRFRRLMLDAARAVAEGRDPIGMRHATPAEKITAATGEIPNNADWHILSPRAHVVLEREPVPS